MHMRKHIHNPFIHLWECCTSQMSEMKEQARAEQSGMELSDSTELIFSERGEYYK